MKRVIVGSIAVLLLATATAPGVRAQTAALNPVTLDNTSKRQLQPFNLVFLANQGYFQAQGIPSYGKLTAAYQMRKIKAIDIVQAAVQANRLPAKVLTDKSYLNAVEAQLRTLQNVH